MTDAHRILLGPDRRGHSAFVEGGVVAWHGLGAPPPALMKGRRKVEHLPCPDAILRPGWVNAHTHLYSGLVPFGVPMPHPWPTTFVAILEQLWWRLDRALDPNALRAAARVAIAEALLAGTTTLIDHHESPSAIAGSLDVLAAEAEALGIRAVLCYGATERNGGPDEAAAGLAECERFSRSIGAEHPTLRAMVGLHAGFTVSDPTITRAAALARTLRIPLHVHVAEDATDVADARQRGYAGSLARLLSLGAVRPGTILAHGIHVAPSELAELAASAKSKAHQAFFVQNPRSNRGNGVGYPSALIASRRVALGTDGYPAHMEAELAAAREEGARFGEPATLAAARLRQGWRVAALHFGQQFGPLRMASSAFATATKPVAADLVAMGPESAVHVLVGGRVVVRNGHLVGADLVTLQEEARVAARRLAKKMSLTRAAAARPSRV